MKIKAFHGTNTRFSKFEQSKARIANDLYGGGAAYFTDDIDIAKSYASSMFRKFGGDRFVYETELNISKLFDVDDKFSGEQLKRLVPKGQGESFARGASLLVLGKDKYALLSQIETGKIELTGEQVFKGLSNGMQNTARAREILKQAGYDGLRYNGGVQMGGKKHNVYLVYDSNQVSIKNRFIVSKTPVKKTATPEVYTFIN